MKAKRFWLIIFISSMMFVSPLVLDVKAQGMGTHAPFVSPTSGPRGTTVSIIFNVTDYLVSHESAGGGFQNRYGTEYKIGFDLGGYPASGGANLYTVRDTVWTPIGTAKVDRNGTLNTTITIPLDALIGDDHYIYVIPPDLDQAAYYWWDFFHVTEGSVPSQPSTPTQPSHPENCTLIVQWDTDKFNVRITPTTGSYDDALGSYSGVYDWGTTVLLNCTYYEPTNWLTEGFGGWNITKTTSQYTLLERAVTVTLDSDTTANPVENHCFIATATYGSELSPEVQFLRNFRETAFMGSFTGQQFVAWFNTVYYSFSPAVASSIASSESSSNWMKASLYPMMGILHLGASAYSAFGFSPDLGIVVFVLLVTSLMSLVYLVPAVLIVLTPVLTIKKKSISTNKIKKMGILWVGGMLVLLVAATAKVPILVMASGAALVGLTVLLIISTAVKLLSENWIWRKL